MEMSAKDNQEAYREAVKALKKDRVDEVKVLVKQALEALHKAEKTRKEAVETAQLIKRDLDDLRAGHLDKIKERHEKNKKADQISPITPQKLETLGLNIRYGSSHSLGTFSTSNVGGSIIGSFTGLGTATPQGQGQVNWSLGQLQNAASGTYLLSDGSIKYF